MNKIDRELSEVSAGARRVFSVTTGVDIVIREWGKTDRAIWHIFILLVPVGTAAVAL